MSSVSHGFSLQCLLFLLMTGCSSEAAAIVSSKMELPARSSNVIMHMRVLPTRQLIKRTRRLVAA
ncbi:uncharacterized protein BJ212DRAFT_1414248 [Suillus subaureus]|uniref:Secreted protein n=1 Tax=Suillus subaureus TaxID=48587 RepID=A0A9P7DI89_9AGAM|nr:uncharacterized protein BJ212DRAFT_1414248 [Suillus subaureus]KAG1793813.1 hypothetical protein BJ212DRAFT_1414248 [Suillus subaureus]